MFGWNTADCANAQLQLAWLNWINRTLSEHKDIFPKIYLYMNMREIYFPKEKNNQHALSPIIL